MFFPFVSVREMLCYDITGLRFCFSIDRLNYYNLNYIFTYITSYANVNKKLKCPNNAIKFETKDRTKVSVFEFLKVLGTVVEDQFRYSSIPESQPC